MVLSKKHKNKYFLCSLFKTIDTKNRTLKLTNETENIYIDVAPLPHLHSPTLSLSVRLTGSTQSPGSLTLTGSTGKVSLYSRQSLSLTVHLFLEDHAPCLIHSSTDSSAQQHSLFPQWRVARPCSTMMHWHTPFLHDSGLPPWQRPSSNQWWFEAAHAGRCAAVARVLLPPLHLDLFLVSASGPYSFLASSYRGTGTTMGCGDGDGDRAHGR
jgi:hypothetical protein